MALNEYAQEIARISLSEVKNLIKWEQSLRKVKFHAFSRGHSRQTISEI